ncbi:MAG: DUF1707 domain-containing protein [Nocardioides sp.]
MSQPPVPRPGPTPSGSHQPHNRDASLLRISDADRNKVAEILREAAGEGRIDFEELDQRLDATFAAKTYGDLVPITLDLPTNQLAIPQPATPAPVRSRVVPAPVIGHGSSLAVMSECRRVGAWQVPEQHTGTSFMGEVRLDLREATFTAGETVIYANAVMGSVQIDIDAYTQVIVEGVGIMGSFNQAKDVIPAQLSDDAPVVRVKGIALMGEVKVTRKPPPGTPRKYFGTY